MDSYLTYDLKMELKDLLKKYLRYNWSLEVKPMKSSLGRCSYVRGGYGGNIILSSYLLKTQNKELIMKTFLHEVAHAIDFERHGSSSHGPLWQQIMIELGLDPDRVANKEDSLEFRSSINYKYTFECPTCGRTSSRNRKSNYGQYACGVCREQGIKSIIVIHQNH